MLIQKVVLLKMLTQKAAITHQKQFAFMLIKNAV